MQLLTTKEQQFVDQALENNSENFQCDFLCEDQDCANRTEEIDDLIEKWLRDDNDEYDELFDSFEEIISESDDPNTIEKAEGLVQELRWHIQRTRGWNGVPESHTGNLTEIQTKTIESNCGVRLTDWNEHVFESVYCYLEQLGRDDVRGWTSAHLDGVKSPSGDDIALENEKIEYFNNLVRKLWGFNAPNDYDGWDITREEREEGEILIRTIKSFIEEVYPSL